MEKMSKNDKVKNHLLKCGSITSWQAIILYRATRLSAIIYSLRKSGMNIETEMVTKGGNTFAKYIYKGE